MMNELRLPIADCRLHAGRLRRRGFSFAEVMFAVIILGIGFIMVAAIFPVAIQQTKLTVEETTAASVAKQATDLLLQITSQPGATMQFPATGAGPNPPVVSIRTRGFGQPAGATGPPDETWERLKGNLIISSDPRFAWAAAYSRAQGEDFARFYVFVIQQRQRVLFEGRDIQPDLADHANLQPRLIRVEDVQPPDPANPLAYVHISAADREFAGEGAFLIFAASSSATVPPTGRVLRLGPFRGVNPAGQAIYELDPAYNLPKEVESGAVTWASLEAWVIGRGLEPSAGNPNLGVPQGAALDAAIYVTVLKVSQ